MIYIILDCKRGGFQTAREKWPGSRGHLNDPLPLPSTSRRSTTTSGRLPPFNVAHESPSTRGPRVLPCMGFTHAAPPGEANCRPKGPAGSRSTRFRPRPVPPAAAARSGACARQGRRCFSGEIATGGLLLCSASCELPPPPPPPLPPPFPLSVRSVVTPCHVQPGLSGNKSGSDRQRVRDIIYLRTSQVVIRNAPQQAPCNRTAQGSAPALVVCGSLEKSVLRGWARLTAAHDEP